MAEINTTAKYVKFIRGSKAAFEKLTSKKPDTLYFIYGEDESVGSLYLGDRLIANGGATSQDVVNTLAGLLDVKVENVNGALEISVYIIVNKEVNVKTIAQEVQENVKDKIQTMTGSAVTRVNVVITDVEISEEEKASE